MSRTCPGHVLDLSICPCFWLKLLFIKDTEWLESCESHVQLKSLNLSHEQLDSSKSEKYWNWTKDQMQIFCAAMSLYHSWMHLCSSTSLHWHLFHASLYVLMLLTWSICTVHPLSCHMVSMSWNDHSLLMQCPGHVQDTCPASCPFGAFLDVLLKDIPN